MTLILTVATINKVVQASDRMLSYPDGRVASDKTNKAVCVTGQDANFCIAYTGIARINSKSTDEWLVDYLAEIHAGEMIFQSICSSLIKQAALSLSVAYRPIPPLTFVLSGYMASAPFIVLISNFEKLKSGISGAPRPEFHGEYCRIKLNSDPMKATLFTVNGCETAITKPMLYKLNHFRKKRFFQNNDAKTIALKLVDIIREASRTFGKYIGRDCMTVAINRNPNEDVICTYHSEVGSLIRYMPHCLSTIFNEKIRD